MTRRLPGERCIGCRRRLSAIGGQRVVAAGAVRVTVIDDGLHPSVEVSGLWWAWFARARQGEPFVRVATRGSASAARAQVFVAAVGLLTTLPQEQMFSPMKVRFSMCRWWQEWGCAASGARGERTGKRRVAHERLGQGAT